MVTEGRMQQEFEKLDFFWKGYMRNIGMNIGNISFFSFAF